MRFFVLVWVSMIRRLFVFVMLKVFIRLLRCIFDLCE